MTSDRRVLLALPLAASCLFLLGACGDYSNEDLAFMNALPENDELRVNLPARSAALAPATEAELARTTHDVTATFNGLLGDLTNMVDYIRSFPPTSRTPDSRTWGPYPTDRAQKINLDWKMRMIMSRDLTVPDQFDYEIDAHEDGTSDLAWIVYVRGSFLAGQTARRGTGHVELVTAGLRAAGFDVSGLGQLDNLVIDYNTLGDPISVNMTVTDLPTAGSSDPASQVLYGYEATAAGQGQMTFDLIGQLIAGPAIEDLRVTSKWLPTGEGIAVLMVVSGDGAGSQQTECWDSSFDATLNIKPWGTAAEQVAGDQALVCPNIPQL
jgi:hypothetical protein